MNSRRDWRRREAEELDGEAVEFVESTRLLSVGEADRVLETAPIRGYRGLRI